MQAHLKVFELKGHLVGFATSRGVSETECDPISRWVSQSMTDLEEVESLVPGKILKEAHTTFST